MPVRIGTNVASISAQNQLQKNFDMRLHSIKALASGKRIVQASDDAAGFAISENLRAQMSGLDVSKRNAQDAVSVVQVAEGALNEQNNILIRLRELSIQSASDTVSDNEREYLDKEFQQLKSEFDRIAETTTYGHNKLLVGENKEYEFQVGPYNGPENRIAYTSTADSRARTLDIDGLDIEDSDEALDSLDSIDSALTQIAGMRADFGAIQSRLLTASNHLGTQFENIASAYSNIADADVAKETANLAQANILSEIGVSVLAQANQNPIMAQRLLSSF